MIPRFERHWKRVHQLSQACVFSDEEERDRDSFPLFAMGTATFEMMGTHEIEIRGVMSNTTAPPQSRECRARTLARRLAILSAAVGRGEGDKLLAERHSASAVSSSTSLRSSWAAVAAALLLPRPARGAGAAAVAKPVPVAHAKPTREAAGVGEGEGGA